PAEFTVIILFRSISFLALHLLGKPAGTLPDRSKLLIRERRVTLIRLLHKNLMRFFSCSIAFHHTPREMRHGGIALPLGNTFLLGLHNTVDGDLAFMPQYFLCGVAKDEPGSIQSMGVEKRKFLLDCPFQCRTGLTVSDRIVGEVHMEPGPCSFPIL